MGIPTVTTDWPLHGPEVEYLRDGVNARIVPDRLDAFSSAVEELLTDGRSRAGLVRGCLESAQVYTLDQMVDRFLGGILTAAGGPGRSSSRGQ
jgi:hypothetical protein